MDKCHGDQKLQQDTGFLRIEIERDRKAHLIVVHFHIAIDEAGADARRAHDKNALFDSLGHNRPEHTPREKWSLAGSFRPASRIA